MSGLTPSSVTRKNAATKYPPEQNGKERRAGLITKADYLKSIGKFRAATGGAADNVLLSSDRNVAIDGSIALHLASNLRLKADESAWDYVRPGSGDPGQILLLRSQGAANVIEYYDAPAAGTNPAVIANRLSIPPADFTDCFRPPRSRIRMAAQSIANITPTAIVYTTNDGLEAGGYIGTLMWDGSTALYARRAGWYIVTTYGYWTNSGGGIFREIAIWRNGAAYVVHDDHATPFSASFFSQMSIATIIYMNAGDYVQTVVYQNSGAALNWNAGLMHAVRLSA